jgi:tight adherence protein B
VVPVTGSLTAVTSGLAAAALVLSAWPHGAARPNPVSRPRRDLTDLTAWAVNVGDRWLPARRARRRDQQLPAALDRLGAALRAGDAIGPALVALAPGLPDPLGADLRPVARAVERGATVASALQSWAGSAHGRPPASRDVRLVAAALTLGAGAGGEVARAVDEVAATIRERHEVAAEARALATQARASATLLVVAPLVFATLVATVEPGALGFLCTTPVGLACLFLGISLDAVGAMWMARITRGVA